LGSIVVAATVFYDHITEIVKLNDKNERNRTNHASEQRRKQI